MFAVLFVSPPVVNSWAFPSPALGPDVLPIAAVTNTTHSEA